MRNRLREFDLNLLIAFRTLVEERSVSRTAERLFVSQPAMSKSLKRLRELCGDELFTRSPDGLIPTPVAYQYYPVVVQALADLEHVLFDAEFSPQTATEEIHVAVLESASSWCIPQLLNRFQKLAPNLSLVTSEIEPDSLDKLGSGVLDFAIYPKQEFGADFELTSLVDFKPTVWLSRKHPLALQALVTKTQLEEYPVVMLDTADVEHRRFIESKGFLRRVGLNLTPILETRSLHTALEVISQSDAILIAPTRMVASPYVAKDFVPKEIYHFDLFDLYTVNLVLIQHTRSKGSSLHQWIRDQFVEVFHSATQ